MAEYVYGKNVVKSLLRGRHEVNVLYVMDSSQDEEIMSLAMAQNIQIRRASRKVMDQMVRGNHQGYIAQIKEYRTYSLEEIIDAIPAGKMPLIVALDELKDPQNLGSILRTLECVGGDGVIIEKNRSVSLTSTVAKVSSGAIERVKVAQVTNLAQTLRNLKKKGYWIVGTDVNEARDYRLLDYNMPMVLVIGSEGSGMRRLTQEVCDFRVKLPMEGEVGSLNASVACGILLYQIYSQRFPV